MMPVSLSKLALGLAAVTPALAATAGSIVEVGDTKVSAMMVRNNSVVAVFCCSSLPLFPDVRR